MLTINPSRMLEALLPRARMAVLTALLTYADRQWHLRALARETGLSAPAVREEANNLAEAGIILRERSGNRVYYRANVESPIFNELLSIIVKTAGVAGPLREALRPLAAKIELAYIYGSFANGTADAKSDVDVMVVGEASMLEVVGALVEASDKLAREVNPTVYSPREYAEALEEGEGFVHEVHHGARIPLIGDSDESA